MKSKFTLSHATTRVSIKRLGVEMNFAQIFFITLLSCFIVSSNAQTGNTLTGISALANNTTGSYNTAIGNFTLFKNTSGIDGTAVGALALYNNDIGRDNTAVGFRSMYSNTMGPRNTAFGRSALERNTIGRKNTATGTWALFSNINGNTNTASGYAALLRNQNGQGNTASGGLSLGNNISGSFNTALGYGANVWFGNLRNATAIGFRAVVTAANSVRIGNAAVTSIGGQVGWTTFSDGRYKQDIKEDVQGLAFINSLRPVTYTVKVKALDGYLNKGRDVTTNAKLSDDDDDTELDKIADTDLQQSEDAAEKITYTGFVAQEVEAAAQKINYAFSGVDKPQSPDGLYGIRYDNFIAPLVKSVQELAKMNSEKDARIDDLQKQINDLKALITTNSKSDITLSDADLKQNTPNPFRGRTTINYTLPEKFTNAQIVVYDISGKMLKQVNVSGVGKGTINMGATALSKGTYNYSLIVDGKVVSTKQMVSE